jgi:hypothetical protein
METADIAALTTGQLQAIAATDLASLTTNQIQALGTNQVQALTTTQVDALTSEQLNAMETRDIAALTTEQIQALALDDLAALSTGQFNALTTSQIQALTTSQIDALTTAQLNAMETQDIAALTTAQVPVITAAELAGMGTGQIAAFSTAAIGALTTDQISNMTTDQLVALTTGQMKALSTECMAVLTTHQLNSMETGDLAVLSNTQVDAIASSVGLDAEHIAALFNVATPLILDLNGDGVRTTGIDAGIRFDLDATGKATEVGWVSADDGFLVLDRNHDGTINNGSELFGSATPLSDGRTARDGFEALSDLDSNRDGIIDAQDQMFNDLTVWQDANQDGLTQQDELHSLNSLGIESFSLAARDVSILDNGNWIGLESNYTQTDGSVHELADVWLQINRAMSQTLDFSSTDPALIPFSGAGRVDLSGNGNYGDTVILGSDDVGRLGKADLVVNAQTGSGHIQMMIQGDANDVVRITDQPGVWMDAGTTQIDGETYRILNDTHQHQLLVGVKIQDPLG